MDQTMREPLRLIWRRKFFIMLVAFACMAGSLWNSAGKPKSFTATTELLVRPVAPSAVFFTFHAGSEEGPLGLDLPTPTQAELIASEIVATRVAEALNLDVSPNTLARAVSAKAISEKFITVTAVWSDAEVSAALADGFAREYIAYRREQAAKVAETAHKDLSTAADRFQSRVDSLDEEIRDLSGQLAAIPDVLPESKAGAGGGQKIPTSVPNIPPEVARVAAHRANIDAAKERKEKERDEQLRQLQQIRSNAADLQIVEVLKTGAGDVTQPAVVPSAATSPNPPRDGLLGFILGLMLGVAIVLARYFLSRRIRTRDDAARAAGAPVLAAVPETRRWRHRREAYLVSLSDPTAAQSDAYRALRANLVAYGVGTSIRRLLVTSVAAKEGKTTAVANLAVAFAKSGLRVLAVSADFRASRLHSFFGVPGEPGLTSVLDGKARLSRAIVGTEIGNLSVLAAGTVDARSGDLLSSHALEEVLTEAESYADVILIDVGALSVSSAAQSVAVSADASLLVVEAGSVETSSVMRAAGQLQQSGAPVLGVLLNRALDEDDTSGILEPPVELMPIGLDMRNGHQGGRSVGLGAGQLVDADGDDRGPGGTRASQRQR